ncbi:multiple monosaccharide ABC transporter permease [Pelagibacterium sp. H642]|uniref:multiple monosaccharide ABC transporter permease n=1 Tax=Pelagibacterium sp. H642 TaxID=1881069 RepID=UPI002814A05D|nr:multiple monosaccharide ABC transporter permease [Pelagibacterium sp. H642]WMT91682.1 sugar ABC transporter permease [Pelagibacterium sp. H642]
MSDLTQSSAQAQKPQFASLGYIRTHMREYGILFALIAIMVFFQIATGGILLRPVNITNLVLQNSYIIIMAVGMLLVIVAGHIDLSVGSVMGFVGALSAVLMVDFNIHFVPAALICLLIGAAIGAIQGYWVAYWKIPSFIVTLAGMLVFKGLMMVILKGRSLGPFPDEFRLIASGFIPDFAAIEGFHLLSMLLGVAVAAILVWLSIRARAKEAKHGVPDEPFAFFVGRNILIAGAVLWLVYLLATSRGLPNVFIIMAVLIAGYSFIAKHTTIGRRIYAVGGNQKAAKLSGINSERLTFLVFANMGMLAALAGLVFAARLNMATPKAGETFELDVIAAVFIGGASMAGGVGTIVGAVIGAFIMGVMNNGMSIMGIGIDWQQMIKGLVLLAAVLFDVYNKNKAA